jgi:hypothetical protein|tara:strand:- start:180 stop:746 length:567 start_codon:yes stop_codon:yes gene_type:complete
MLDPRRWRPASDEIVSLAENPIEAEVVLAMAKVGWAFCQVHLFEQTLSGYILSTSEVSIGKNEKYEHLDAGAAFLLKHELLNKSMLGQMTGHLKKAGLANRDAKYLELLVSLRNDFIHRFSSQVPLPGDWPRYGYTAEDFSQFPQDVGRHFELGCHHLSSIFIRAGFLKGETISDGMLLWDASSELFE